MGGLIRRISAAVKTFRSFEEYDEKKWNDWIHGPLTKASTRINEVSSLKISSVYAAVNFIAGTVATLPRVIYRRLRNGGKERAFDHPLYNRLHNMPNDSGMTAWQWIFTQLVHKFLWGNWYTWIDMQSFQNRELIPLLPDRTYQDSVDETVYITHKKDGTQLRLPRSQVLHIPHFSLDGVKGKGVIHYTRESLGIAKAADEFAGLFFGSGVHQGGFVEVEQAMDIAFFDEEERPDHFVKFELKGLLRGDLKARTEFYNAMLDRGVFNADMVLDLEDMNPQPEGVGQVFMVPLNMVNKQLVISPQPLTIESVITEAQENGNDEAEAVE